MKGELIYNREHIDEVLSRDNIFVITDANVARLYPFVTAPRGAVVAAGEDSKSTAVWSNLIAKMVAAGCDRQTTVVAVGGGVVGDLSGFVAATFMRGVRWINIPTTLLAQVDSGIGGKTAIDVDGYKNVAGAFWLPEEVVLSSHWLDTLPPREKLCGEGEVFKTALLSPDVYKLYRPGAVDAATIRACADFKFDVTSRDFTEGGLRKILNVGHTVGHALEREDDHRRSHGEYVVMGICLESYLCRDRIDPDFYRAIQETATQLCDICAFEAAKIAAAAAADKKNRDGKIIIMETRAVGNVVERAFTRKQIEEGLSAWKSHR